MKASSFSDAQKAFILSRERMARRWRISAGGPGSARLPYFSRKKNAEGFSPLEMRRLEQLKDEKGSNRKAKHVQRRAVSPASSLFSPTRGKALPTRAR